MTDGYYQETELPKTPPPHWVIMPVMGAPELTEAAIGDVLVQTIPCKLLIINQGVEEAFRTRLEQIAEEYPSCVLLWSHQPPLPSLAATWNRALRFVWSVGGEEALVINNDIRLMPSTYEDLRSVLRRTRADFVSGVGVTAEQFAVRPEQRLWKDVETIRADEKGGPDFSCFVISPMGHWRFPFDEQLIPAFCEDLDLHRRFLLDGRGQEIFSVNLPFHHVGGGSNTLKGMTPKQRQAHERAIDGGRAYYQRKWGGGVNQETFVRPFSGEAIPGVTTPELQASERMKALVEEDAEQEEQEEAWTTKEQLNRAVVEELRLVGEGKDPMDFPQLTDILRQQAAEPVGSELPAQHPFGVGPEDFLL